MQQVLCIETGRGPARKKPIKGNIYNSKGIFQQKIFYKGVDAWHSLEEMIPGDMAHVCLFIDLPSQEGQSFKKEETVEIPQELKPFYSQR
jgi:hypothetical protein